MSLTRTILEKNTDPSFVSEILTNESVKKNGELVRLLNHGKEGILPKWIIENILFEYEDMLKMAIEKSYHPIVIKHLQEYSQRSGVTHWSIAKHPFLSPDLVYDFFDSNKSIDLKGDGREQIVKHAFSEDSILVWSSLVYVNEETLHINFSKAKKNEINTEGLFKIEFIEEWFAHAKRDGIHKISSYMKEKFPEHTLFEILKLDPDQVL